MNLRYCGLALALAVASTVAVAKPALFRGGAPHVVETPTPPTTSLCAAGLTGDVCATFQNGQTFVTWTDMATGAAGNNWRYSMYRSTAPITSGNYGAATLIASYILNNSAHLIGGDPSSAVSFAQTYRQDPARPRVVFSDLGAQRPYGSGVQVYTALGAASAYYAIIAQPAVGGVLTGAPATYIGSVGPISEDVGTWTPYKFADSLNRGQNYGKITSTAGKPGVFWGHASGTSGGAAGSGNSIWGDYWVGWGTAAQEHWQDGRQITINVLQDNGGKYPSLGAGAVQVADRDTIVNPLGTNGLEQAHWGGAFSPNPLVGPPNRVYKYNFNNISRIMNWAVNHYGLDPNALYWQGHSLGAHGGILSGMRMQSPKFAAIFAELTYFRLDRKGPSFYCGYTWTSAMPFRTSLGMGAQNCGPEPIPDSILMDDGSTFNSWAKTPVYFKAHPEIDFPVLLWGADKDDWSPFDSTHAGIQHSIEALDAFQTARHGHFFNFQMGNHDTNGHQVINCDYQPADAEVCYPKTVFRLDLPYPAFTHSSIDDNVGTATRNAFGIVDGDYVGCINCGFYWEFTTDTAGALNFTVGNKYMTRSPTTLPTTSTTSVMAPTGNAPFTVADGAILIPNQANNYYLIDSTEIIIASRSGNTLTPTSRGRLGTSSLPHGAGASVLKLVEVPTGPNGGPYTSMTVDITPRRRQAFLPANAAAVQCTVTPFGGAPSVMNLTVADTIFTLPAVPINAGGVTTISCTT